MIDLEIFKSKNQIVVYGRKSLRPLMNNTYVGHSPASQILVTETAYNINLFFYLV